MINVGTKLVFRVFKLLHNIKQSLKNMFSLKVMHNFSKSDILKRDLFNQNNTLDKILTYFFIYRLLEVYPVHSQNLQKYWGYQVF